MRAQRVAPPGAETTIAIPPPSGKAGEKDTRISLQTDDIDALHAELRSRGVDVDDEVTRMGESVPPVFWFRDAEQNTLMAGTATPHHGATGQRVRRIVRLTTLWLPALSLAVTVTFAFRRFWRSARRTVLSAFFESCRRSFTTAFAETVRVTGLKR